MRLQLEQLEGSKMQYEKPNYELVFSDDIIVTSFLVNAGVGSGNDDDERIAF